MEKYSDRVNFTVTLHVLFDKNTYFIKLSWSSMFIVFPKNWASNVLKIYSLSQEQPGRPDLKLNV